MNPLTVKLALALLAITLLAYSLYVAYQVMHAETLSAPQKALQLALVLLVPLFGPALAHVVLMSDRESMKARNRDFKANRDDEVINGQIGQPRVIDDA